MRFALCSRLLIRVYAAIAPLLLSLCASGQTRTDRPLPNHLELCTDVCFILTRADNRYLSVRANDFAPHDYLSVCTPLVFSKALVRIACNFVRQNARPDLSETVPGVSTVFTGPIAENNESVSNGQIQWHTRAGPGKTIPATLYWGKSMIRGCKVFQYPNGLPTLTCPDRLHPAH